MGMSEGTFRLLSKGELEDLYHVHMERDFPPDELKPLSRLFELMEPMLFIGEPGKTPM